MTQLYIRRSLNAWLWDLNTSACLFGLPVWYVAAKETRFDLVLALAVALPLAVAFLVGSAFTYLRVTDAGISVRNFWRVHQISWEEVERVEHAGRWYTAILQRSGATTEFFLKDGTSVRTYATMRPSVALQEQMTATLCSLAAAHEVPVGKRPIW